VSGMVLLAVSLMCASTLEIDLPLPLAGEGRGEGIGGLRYRGAWRIRGPSSALRAPPIKAFEGRLFSRKREKEETAVSRNSMAPHPRRSNRTGARCSPPAPA
jgi:hypothetical protein